MYETCPDLYVFNITSYHFALFKTLSSQMRMSFQYGGPGRWGYHLDRDYLFTGEYARTMFVRTIGCIPDLQSSVRMSIGSEREL
ncbi:unnamed protein product [Phytomonas sp. Hart1]|nr:unnamed protein product [Phytomonas sp. Hart1]|eukprot:CCW70245.1 unnamed protein product [Phytomonas sp. isolate Hart1]